MSTDAHPLGLFPIWDDITRSYHANRLAHAYIVVGPPRTRGHAFARQFAQLLYCSDTRAPCGQCSVCRGIEQGRHPDIHWLEPQSKSGKITAADVRGLTRQLYQSSFEGGWKMAVILYAERMPTEAANAFLKTLEEPPDKTLILLLVEAFHALLPTIVSRCQRIVLPYVCTVGQAPWCEEVLALLRSGWPDSPLLAAGFAQRLRTIFETEKERLLAETDDDENAYTDTATRDARLNARYLETRAEILEFILMWYRDVLLATYDVQPGLFHHEGEKDMILQQASSVNYGSVIQRINRFVAMMARLERNLPEAAVMEAVFNV